MTRRIIYGVVAVACIILAVMWYRNWKAQNSLGNGDVYTVNTPDSKAGAYNQPNSAATANVPPANSISNQPPAPTQSTPPTDTQPPNNPYNARFAGAGRYQWYRQGNLTWRIDSQTGNSCVAFATDDEWRKPRVYQNGCNNR